MLIKKTIVISDGVNAVGHLSLVRVGGETGAKLTLSKPYDGAYLMIKVSGNEQENFVIGGLKSEYKLVGNVEPNARIGTVIMDESGVLARGGVSGMISEKLPEKEREIKEESILGKSVKEELKEEVEEPKIVITEQVEEGGESESDSPKKEEVVLLNSEDSEKKEGEEKPRSESIISPFNSVRGEHFYRSVRGKLSEIMTANPREEKLEALIPDSKWVRVYYDKGEYYVVGILTEDGEVTFLAYGVPGVKRVKPPKEAEELCDFVEVESSLGDGYWIMFQNAKNGEIVKTI